MDCTPMEDPEDLVFLLLWGSGEVPKGDLSGMGLVSHSEPIEPSPNLPPFHANLPLRDLVILERLHYVLGLSVSRQRLQLHEENMYSQWRG